MIDGIPNRPIYFYQKDIIENMLDHACATLTGQSSFGEQFPVAH